MPRRKTVELDGCQWKVRSLTIREVDELLHRFRELNINEDTAAQLAADSELTQKLTDIWKDLICRCTDGQLTREKIDEELDLPSFNFLREQILEFSGLRPAEELRQAGEPQPSKN